MEVPFDVIKIISSHTVKHRMKLLDWVRLNDLDWVYLSVNPNTIDVLESNQDKINLFTLSINPNGNHLFEENPSQKIKIDYGGFSKKPSIFEPDINQINKAILCQAMKLDPIIN